MKNLLLVISVFISAAGWAQGDAVPELVLCDTSMSDKSSDHLKSALAHINSFEYIRGVLKAYQNSGHSYCADGVMLTKNIYQYYKYFWNIQVRAADGKLEAVVPLYFQSASIQAHHNSGHKPWIVVDRQTVSEYFRKKVKEQVAQQTVSVSEFSVKSLYEISKAQSWWPKVAEDTFSITNLESKDGNQYYLATWVYGVNNGSLYTQHFTSKAVIFKYNPTDQNVEVSELISGYSLVVDFLEKSLEQTAKLAPADATTWDEYILETLK